MLQVALPDACITLDSSDGDQELPDIPKLVSIDIFAFFIFAYSNVNISCMFHVATHVNCSAYEVYLQFYCFCCNETDTHVSVDIYRTFLEYQVKR